MDDVAESETLSSGSAKKRNTLRKRRGPTFQYHSEMQLPSEETFFTSCTEQCLFRQIQVNNHHWLKFLTSSVIMPTFIPDRDSYGVPYYVDLSQVPTNIESEYELFISCPCKMCEQSSGSTSAVQFFCAVLWNYACPWVTSFHAPPFFFL